MLDLSEQAITGLTTVVIATLTTLAMNWINWKLNRQTFSSTVEARIEGLFDRLVEYRLKHPEVLKLSRNWTPDCLTKVYAQTSEEDKAWAIYVGYVDLCIGYCNAALMARRRGRLSRDIYSSQYEPLMKLLISEHFPVIRQFAREGGFVSSGLSDYIKDQRRRGWNWEVEFQNMDKVR